MQLRQFCDLRNAVNDKTSSLLTAYRVPCWAVPSESEQSRMSTVRLAVSHRIGKLMAAVAMSTTSLTHFCKVDY